MFDGSSIDGFVRIKESDMCIIKGLPTFVVFSMDCRFEVSQVVLLCL